MTYRRTTAASPLQPGRGRPRLISTTQPSQPIEMGKSLHETVANRLRAMIEDGELSPGQQIVEAALSVSFGISRTPLREAIKVLASEGLVELRPRRTPVVAAVDGAEIGWIFQVMEGLEAIAGRQAVKNATADDIDALARKHEEFVACHKNGDRVGYGVRNREFHLMIVQLARNPVLTATYSGFVNKIQRARAAANLDSNRWNVSTNEHERILAAFRSRSPDAVVGELVDHMRNTAAAVLHNLFSIKGALS